MTPPDDLPPDVRERLNLNGNRIGVTVSPSPNRAVTPVTPLRFAEMAPPSSREYLAEGIVPQGHTTTIFGDGGSAKSVPQRARPGLVSREARCWLSTVAHTFVGTRSLYPTIRPGKVEPQIAF